MISLMSSVSVLSSSVATEVNPNKDVNLPHSGDVPPLLYCSINKIEEVIGGYDSLSKGG